MSLKYFRWVGCELKGAVSLGFRWGPQMIPVILTPTYLTVNFNQLSCLSMFAIPFLHFQSQQILDRATLQGVKLSSSSLTFPWIVQCPGACSLFCLWMGLCIFCCTDDIGHKCFNKIIIMLVVLLWYCIVSH